MLLNIAMEVFMENMLMIFIVSRFCIGSKKKIAWRSHSFAAYNQVYSYPVDANRWCDTEKIIAAT